MLVFKNLITNENLYNMDPLMQIMISFTEIDCTLITLHPP